MTATGHAVIGTVIAAQFGNPYIAIPLALFSHIAADVFPHWDSGTHGHKKTRKRFIIEAAVDVLVGFALSFAILQLVFPQTDLFYAFIIVIAAQALDWATVPYIIGIKVYPFTLLYEFQSSINTKLDKPWGIITQAGVLLFLILLVKAL